jgi:two-component system sensor histidine kinase HydH
MQKPYQRLIGRAVVPLGAGVLVLALAVSLWALTLRERANKRLYLEYEVHKSLTSLSDLQRVQTLDEDDLRNVLAFGLYAADGSVITSYGNAPRIMDIIGPNTAPSRFMLGEASVVLMRALGGELPGRRMMMGTDRSGRMRSQPTPLPPPAGPDSQSRVPAYSYIEISTVGFRTEEFMSLVVATAATAALAGLWVVIVAMNRRYALSKVREARDRELVELGQAARTIAHEIKNPLGVIRIQCGILRKGASEATVSGLAVIDDEAQRLAELADRIRRFLKSGGEGVMPVQARRYLSDFVARYAGTIDADLEMDDSVVVAIDESRMTEALDNIVTNAIEAGAGGVEKPRIEVRVKAHRLYVSILDRGPGVEPLDAGRIFEPFFTTKTRGSGLGLALARKNVEAFGGTVTYADRPNGGSIFTVTLPLEKPDQQC